MYTKMLKKLKQAVNDIVLRSKSFDNGMICAEQAAMRWWTLRRVHWINEKHHVYYVNKEEKAKLEKLVFGAKS